MGMEVRMEPMNLFLEVENDSLEKAMETLTPMEVFIGFPTKLKWFEFTKDLGHLISPKMGHNWLINPTSPTN